MTRVLVLVLLGGCSFIGVRGPAAPDDPTGCGHDSYVPAVIDGALAAAMVAATADLASHSNGSDSPLSEAHPYMIATSAVLGAVLAASAVHGARAVNRCRDARAATPRTAFDY